MNLVNLFVSRKAYFGQPTSARTLGFSTIHLHHRHYTKRNDRRILHSDVGQFWKNSILLPFWKSCYVINSTNEH